MKTGTRTRGRLTAALLLAALLTGCALPPALAAHDPQAGHGAVNLRFWKDEAPDIRFYINAGNRYILETVTEPEVGSTFGDWSVIDLLRGMYTGADYLNYIPDTYFTDYLDRVETYVADRDGILDRSKSTEWSRLILALTALGQDITDVAGYDFIDHLSQSFTFSLRQGINGPIWEIIAMNTGGYQFSPANSDDANTFGKLIDYILSLEITGEDGAVGGWALSGNVPDPDVTGMALQALAPYYLDGAEYASAGAETGYTQFCQAVERGILTLSDIQHDNGGYDSWGTVNSESIAQVIAALTALDIDPLSDEVRLDHIGETCSFIKGGATRDGVWTDNMIDALLAFWAPGSGSAPEVGGFRHVTAGSDGGGGSGTGVNTMATDQAVYGLIAYDRWLSGENALYDMTDMSAGQYRTYRATERTVSFDLGGGTALPPVTGSPYSTVSLPVAEGAEGTAVVYWSDRPTGGGTAYAPGELLVLPGEDITLYAQYEPYQNTYPVLETEDHITYISGYTDGTVKPEGKITRAEAATMFYNLIVDENKAEPVDNVFSDVGDDWYTQAVGYLAKHGIITGFEQDGVMTFAPDSNITRAQFATIVSRFDDLVTGDITFADVEADHWAADYIVNAAARGWITGYAEEGGNVFLPEEEITRAEAVTLVNRVLGRQTPRENIPEGINPFSDLTEGHWAYQDILEAAVPHEYRETPDGNETWTSW